MAIIKPTKQPNDLSDHINNPLCFTALDNCSFDICGATSILCDSSEPPIEDYPPIAISFDGNEWCKWNYDTIELKKDEKVYFKSPSEQFSSNTAFYSFRIFKGKIAASGNCMSLTNGKISPYCFFRLFQNCKGLVTPPELPSTRLAEGCYHSMFSNCESLETAPNLPAVSLEEKCYSDMFEQCYSLKQCPELPATNMKDGCYFGMFCNCESIKEGPKLPALNLNKHCYMYMFCGCKSLTTAPDLPAKESKVCCYAYMFYNCESLKKKPNIALRGKVEENATSNMFTRCTNLSRKEKIKKAFSSFLKR